MGIQSRSINLEMHISLRPKVSEFTRSALTVFSGAFFSQLLLVLATPWLTRRYSPSAFGELALFSSWYSILASLFTLKFELTILLPTTSRESIRLVKLTILIASIFSIGCLFFFIALQSSGFDIPLFFFLLPFMTFISGVYSAMLHWFSRNKRFSIAASSNVINSGMNIFICFLLLAVPIIRSGQLIVGYFLGLTAATIYCGFHLWKSDQKHWAEASAGYKELLRAYSDFPRYMVLTSLIGVLSYQIIPLLLKHYFTMETVGYFSMAGRFLFLPSILIGTAIGEVFRVEFARQKNENIDLRPIFLMTLKKMLYIGIPIFLGLLFLSPLIFRLVLGKAFSTSGTYAQSLCLAMFGQFLFQPFNAVFIILRQMKYYFIFQVLLTLAPVLAIPAGALLLHSVTGALFLISLITLSLTALMILKAYRLVSPSSFSAH